MARLAHSQTTDESFLARLRAAIELWPPPATRRFVVAFSGGIDSTVLLAALGRLGICDSLRAVHVDHGLHADSAAWRAHCAAAAAALGVRYEAVRVEVDRSGGRGLEAAAREARYGALAARLAPGEVLLTAHHGDDQLETLLLRFLRGAGVRGLRGVIGFASFGPGFLGRPLLGFSRAELREQATRWGLSWLEDPANLDLRHDRNFLREVVVPRLVERWPAAVRMAERLAGQMEDAEEVLAAMAERDAEGIADRARVPRSAAAPLSASRQRNLLRWLIRQAGLGTPSAVQLEELRRGWLDARADAQTRVQWAGADARVYRGHLYLARALPPASSPDYRAALEGVAGWSGPEGEIRFERLLAGPGLPQSWLDAGLELRFRAGGERFRPLGRAHSWPLKRWLQQAAIVPWMRGRIPLLYRGDRLIAVGDLWLAEDVRAAGGTEPCWRVRWTGHPALH